MIHFGQGASGWPFLTDQSVVESEASRPLRLGDLAVFDSKKIATCHRVLAIKKWMGMRWYLFKGDCNLQTDGWIPEYRIEGRVVQINGKRSIRLVDFLAWGMSWFSVSASVLALRKSLGGFVFRHLSPSQTAADLDVSEDYGHAAFHDSLIIRDQEDITFALRVVGPSDTTLDLGGGSGRFALPLVKQGRRVHLVERSQSMLSLLASEHSALDAALRSLLTTERRDLVDFKATTSYDHVFLLNNVLEHLGNQSEVLFLLREAANALKTDGHLYLDIHHLAHFESRSDWRSGRWHYHADRRIRGERFRLWSRTLPGHRPGQTRLEHAVRKGLEKPTISRLALTLFPISVWRALFAAAGLEIVQEWGNWTGAPLQAALPKLIFVLRAKTKTPGESFSN